MNANIQMLEVIASGLGPLLDEVVFVGGATTTLYIDSKAAPEPRPTEDVDCVIEIAGRVRYGEFEEKLRALGFSHDSTPGAPTCRFKYQGVLVDVMPTDEKVLGFSNRWYPEGIRNSEKRTLPSGTEINIFSLPYLLASKIEAYLGRGNGDPRTSSDIEDIIFVLDGNSDPLSSIRRASKDVRHFLAIELARADLGEAIEGALHYEGTGRVDRVKALVAELVLSTS